MRLFLQNQVKYFAGVVIAITNYHLVMKKLFRIQLNTVFLITHPLGVGQGVFPLALSLYSSYSKISNFSFLDLSEIISQNNLNFPSVFNTRNISFLRLLLINLSLLKFKRNGADHFLQPILFSLI